MFCVRDTCHLSRKHRHEHGDIFFQDYSSPMAPLWCAANSAVYFFIVSNFTSHVAFHGPEVSIKDTTEGN